MSANTLYTAVRDTAREPGIISRIETLCRQCIIHACNNAQYAGLIACIKVLSSEKLLVIFKTGLEKEVLLA